MTAATGTYVFGRVFQVDCWASLTAANGYTQVSIGGHLTADDSNMGITIYLVDGNGTGVSTLNQEFDAWQVSP
jgi:hypothetical protein